jgi:hypothetical protein
MGRKPKNPIDPVTGKRRRGRPKKEWTKGEAKPTNCPPDTGIPDVIPPPSAPSPEETAVATLAGDLDEEERNRFANLLRQKMTLEKRAELLVEIAQMTDTKRAPVALRAIQEINQLTGLAEKPMEESALFILPAGSEIAVATKTPRK